MNTEGKPKKRKLSIALFLEEWGPILCGVLVLVALVVFYSSVSGRFGEDKWQSDGLYSAIFDWSAIQTGFAFGVYGFVIGKTDGFVAKLKNTTAMNRFVNYIKRANMTGFLLTLGSIPLIVVNPSVSTSFAAYLVVAVWFSVFVWSFMSFLRLAYNFGIIASVKDITFKGA